ncbi:MAG: hypothetical protein NVS1B7_4600 [Candidatus Saccharimonadales bacterium]
MSGINLTQKAIIAAGILSVAVVGLGSTSVYAARSNALPGSALYPLKQGWEQVHLFLSFSPASEAKTRVGIAHNRLLAAQQVPSPSPTFIPTLHEVNQQLNTALNQSNKISDPVKRKEIKDSVSKEANEAEVELEHSSELESTSDKQEMKKTSDELKHLRDQASTKD